MRKTLILLFILLASLSGGAQAHEGYSILIDKGDFTLTLLDAAGEQVLQFPVATGENPGQKTRAGDNKTPEGVFRVEWVQNTRGVLYDYHDGKGKVEAYGPYFIHLLVPGFRSLGIHGTCPERDDRIGTRDSKGCVRLHNADLLQLIPYVYPGMSVSILPGPTDRSLDEYQLQN